MVPEFTEDKYILKKERQDKKSGLFMLKYLKI